MGERFFGRLPALGGGRRFGRILGGSNLGGFARRFLGGELGTWLERLGLAGGAGGLGDFVRRRVAEAGFARRNLGGLARQFLLGERFAAPDLVAAAVAAVTVAAAAATAAAGAMVRLGVGGALVALFLRQQRLPVGDRDLVIVRVDFGKRQEAVPVAAVVDEGGLQRRLYARDLGEIDVTAQLLALGAFEVEFLDAVATQHHDPGLFRVGRVDQHFVGHC